VQRDVDDVVGQGAGDAAEEERDDRQPDRTPGWRLRYCIENRQGHERLYTLYKTPEQCWSR
jgi:chloramphenicol 3-O-phosphotransferase